MNLKLKTKIGNLRRGVSQYIYGLKAQKKKGLPANIVLPAFDLYKKTKSAILKNDHPMAAKLFLRTRRAFHHINGENFSFVSLDKAMVWTTEWIKSFPETYDIVVGIPRSGMMVASLVALKLGKPLTTPELFSKGEYWMSWKIKERLEIPQMKSVLLIDDAVDHGKSMREAMEILSSVKGNFKITKAALIVNKNSTSLVDLYHAIVPHPKLYEWNILHRKVASYWDSGKVGFDMDGVICENCPPNVDNSEASYVNWLKNAKPYLIPNYTIDVIISSRLEKYRGETESWLAKHGVKYGELVLWNIPTKGDRNSRFAQYKVEQLLKYKPDLFLESHLGQAEHIWKATKIPTLCIDEMVLFS